MKKILLQLCSISLLMSFSFVSEAVSVKINSPANGAVIQSDNTVVTGIASAVGTPGQGIDLVLVLDDSGSLGTTDPTRERFSAIQQLMTSFGPNADVHVGIIFFTGSASVAVSLQQVNTARPAINGAIQNNQTPGGGTAIDSGIQLASNELASKGRANASKAILVFTDGGNNSGPEPVKQAAAAAFSQNQAVSFIGLFPSNGTNPSDLAALQQAAQVGGGKFYRATDPVHLAPLFRAAKIVSIDNVTVTNVTTGRASARVNLTAGNFTGNVDLVVGQNILKAVATDTDGKQAADSITVTVQPICPDDTNPICPCPNPSNPSCPAVPVKKASQVIMGGFDPMLIDFAQREMSYKIMAVVREGSAPIRSVSVKKNEEAFKLLSNKMNLEGQLSNGDKIYSLSLVMDRTYAFEHKGEPLANFFGSGVGEYNITVVDESQEVHSFPNLNMGNHPHVMIHALTEVHPYKTKGIRRFRPQVLMSGLDPMLLDYGDDSFKIKAIVRPGRTGLQNVTLKNGSGFKIAMNREGDIGNGDIMYSAEYTFPRGAFPAGSLRDLFGNVNLASEFLVEAIDDAQNKHAFPALEICGGRGCPEYKP
ncbi:VWA domain-containing protein [Candidatus Marithrix sp. Canyon 246]|uniref:VWA domain-containing protein n=1 Tax=Candidatus Marithrix sp. Canyon 246 TaxID=1827136 RepID=UPI00084A1028|nr:VWA domain-containing protein [Candidatus Marithrix sp. Canyon 246]